MGSKLLVVLFLVGLPHGLFAQTPYPRTPNLHLKFTSDGTINSDLGIIDSVIGDLRRMVGPCLDASSGAYGLFDYHNTATDLDDVPINTALANLKKTAGTPAGCVWLGPGTWNLSAPINLPSHAFLIGAGKFATTLISPASGTGFNLIQASTPRTCNGGTGALDAAWNTSARGAGAVCHRNADCQSGACTGGTAIQKSGVSGIRFFLQAAGFTAMDMALMNESEFQQNFILGQVNTANLYGIIASDGGTEADCGAGSTQCTGYMNTIAFNRLEGGSSTNRLENAIIVEDKANGTVIAFNDCKQNAGRCLDIESNANAVRVIGNHFQSAVTELVRVNGIETVIDANRFEDSNSSNITIGASASKVRLSINNYFSGGAGGKVTDIATLSGGLAVSTVDGVPGPTDSPGYACDAADLSRSYFDLSTWQVCVCQNASVPAFGLNATAATCGTTSTTTTTTTTTT